MPGDPPAAIYAKPGGNALDQGEVISDLSMQRVDPATLSGELELIEVRYPYAVVLTQGCDLDRDWEYRSFPPADRPQLNPKELARLEGKRLENLLLCVARLAAEVRPAVGGSDIWKRIEQNKDERYQLLEAVPSALDGSGEGVQALCLDFRLCFTVPADELYERLKRGVRRRSVLVTPYKEHLSARFAYYHARIGLLGLIRSRGHQPRGVYGVRHGRGEGEAEAA